ncbi:MAG: hypothetical protein DELT_01164 [Desulfovibrio sp.]
MSHGSKTPFLLVGEVFVDFTVTESGQENKLRLGGIAHAARGFWAVNSPFSVAAVLPEYSEGAARTYFHALGCVDFHVLGYVQGAPNVTVIFDPIEVADQKYETLLRDEKNVKLLQIDFSNYAYQEILVFPGSYDLSTICAALPQTASLHLDVGYDFNDPSVLSKFTQTVQTILISTSSPLFKYVGSSLQGLLDAFSPYTSATLIFKENRGGARMVFSTDSHTEILPAQLGVTANSVGVGDVFASVYVANLGLGCIEAGWRASYAAAAYSQTTYPDLFKTYVQRDLELTVDDMQQLGGAYLPWEKRREYQIYLAAPDFSYAKRQAIDTALASLAYHNFFVRRPIVENGELQADSGHAELQETYKADYALLKKCTLLFAIPTERDPGTLVEIGIAIEAHMPVIVYDPMLENKNTMIMAGAQHYSDNLDSCLNAVFRILSGSQQ